MPASSGIEKIKSAAGNGYKSGVSQSAGEGKQSAVDSGMSWVSVERDKVIRR